MTTQNLNHDNDNDNEKRKQNSSWNYLGRLSGVSVFQMNGKNMSWIETDTSGFCVEGVFSEMVHWGQTVKSSKVNPKMIKVGTQTIYKP